MNKSAKIVVIGSSNTDMVATVKDFPKPGQTIFGEKFLMNAGGKGANQAVAAARCGGEVTFIGKVGQDPTGNQSIKNLKAENIDTSTISVDVENPSGVALILVNDEGENMIIVASGSNMSLSLADIDSAQSQISSAQILLLQLETPLDTVIYACKKGFELGKKVILNPAPAVKLPDIIYPYLHIITPNETETEILTGIKVSDEVTALEASNILRNKGVDTVIITMGAAGAFINSDALKTMVPAPKVKAIDTTAAGDCFNGALAAALTLNMSMHEAVEFANKAASISVTRMGAQNSLPYTNELSR